MKMPKPKCPVCSTTISFLEVKKEFNCPKCGSALRSSGQGKIMAFEILAFLILGWIFAGLFIQGSYVAAALVIVAWVVAEIYVRNAFVHLELVSSTDAGSQASP